jgi:hypothetical protein
MIGSKSRISFLSDDRSLEICQDGQFQRYGSAELRRFLSYILWVIRLSPDKARRVLSRLKLSRDLAKDALSACELWKELDTLVDLPPSSATTYLEKLSTLSIKAAYLATDNNQQRGLLRTYETSWSKIMPFDHWSRSTCPGIATWTCIPANIRQLALSLVRWKDQQSPAGSSIFE